MAGLRTRIGCSENAKTRVCGRLRASMWCWVSGLELGDDDAGQNAGDGHGDHCLKPHALDGYDGHQPGGEPDCASPPLDFLCCLGLGQFGDDLL